uniref:Uncharacterized protein n=1 Tax=Glossina brevipalpis TaxID=37001 RepID=A0A1A9WPX4_9MUSC
MLRDSSSDSSTTLTPDKRHNVALSVNRAYSTKENLDQSSTLYTSLSDSESSRILFRDQSSLVHVGTEASLWNLAKDIKGDQVLNLPTQQSTTIKVVKNANSHFSSMPLVALIVVLLLPINDFLRGVLACLFFVMTLENILIFLGIFADRFFLSFKTQKAPFTLPDYFEMPSIEIPPVKEQSTYKQYEGWMNEIDVYDLETYHISMTRPVHLKLEGTMLQVSNTNDYVKKRVLYGDEPIDMNHITFTTKRVYNLFGCRVELLPKGLPRRRSEEYLFNNEKHFGRKFPIQLVIKASSIIKIEKFAVQQKKKLDKVKVIPSEKRQKNIDLMRNPLTKTASDERHDEHLETDRRDKHLERLNHKLNVRTNESDSKVTSKEKYVEFREEPSTVSYQDQSSSAESFESEGIFEQLDGHEEILDYKEIGTQSSSTDFIDSSHPNEKYNNEIVENNSIGKLEKNFDLDKQASSTENIGEIEAIDLMAASNNKKEEISNTADVVSINTNVTASKGDIKDRDINLANTRDIGEEDVKAASAAADTLANPHHIQLKRQQKHGFHKIAEIFVSTSPTTVRQQYCSVNIK